MKTTVLALLLLACASAASLANAAHPGSRVVMDAHNCYPYGQRWFDRIDRALASGTPVAIEQDLYWYTDPVTGRSWSVVSHGGSLSGSEPTMRQYFFERIRPQIERALKDGNRGDWPLVTLNLDFKTEEPAHLAAVWNLLHDYQDWLTSATRTANISDVQPLDVRPLLVLTGSSRAQQRAFYDHVPVGSKLLAFGAVRVRRGLQPGAEDNYHRWLNASWNIVERGGPSHARTWDAQSQARLDLLVKRAHDDGLWIRFYTLDGSTRRQSKSYGWFHHYNFGSLAAAEERWRAAADAGADYIASDQYEDLGKFLRQSLKADLSAKRSLVR